MTEPTKLTPCPFCGAAAHFEMDEGRWEWVECESCGMQGNRSASLMEDCKPKLAEAWNRRTPAPVGVEPIGYLYCGGSYGDELEDWEIVANQHQCDKLNEYHGSLGKEAKLPIYTTPHPTQAQAIPGVQWQCGPQANGFTAPQADSQPVRDERDDFEKVFPLPSGCIRVGTGYASTDYSNWAAHTHVERWKGWRARAARAPADSVTAPAAGAVAHTLSDAQIEAMPVWRNFVGLWPESRREIVDAVVDLLAAAPTPPAQGVDSVLEDAARLDWLLLHISGAEFRRIGVHYSGNARRADVDAARKQGANHD